jgi:hypothetical protein
MNAAGTNGNRLISDVERRELRDVLRRPDVGVEGDERMRLQQALEGDIQDADGARLREILEAYRQRQQAPRAARGGMLTGLREAGIINPELILPNDHRHPHETAEVCFAHLATTGKFFRQGKAVVVLEEKGLEELTPEEFRSRLAKFFDLRAAIVGRNGQQVLRQKSCSLDNAKALMACEEVDLLPPIQSVIHSPAFVDDRGTLRVLDQGYHATNGGTYVLNDRVVVEDLPLEEAVRSLLDILEDFSFATPADKSRCLAGFISPALRFGWLLKAAFPMDLCEADQSQTGKGFRVELITAIYDEVPHLMTLPSEAKRGVGSIDEGVSEALLSGKPFVILDNMRGEINSQLLESAIKGVGNTVSARRPYGRPTQVKTDHVLWMGTSNRAQATIDLANRAVITRLRKQPLNYKFRDYEGKGLLEHVKSNKDYYLSCVYAVTKAWVEAGKPKTPNVDHDFREWCGAMGWIVQNLFKLPPLLDGHREQQTRVASGGLTFLLAVCNAISETGHCGEMGTAGDIADILMEQRVVPEGCEETVDRMEWAQKIGGKLARLFGEKGFLYVGEYRIELIWKDVRNEERRETKPRRHYVFTKCDGSFVKASVEGDYPPMKKQLRATPGVAGPEGIKALLEAKAA